MFRRFSKNTIKPRKAVFLLFIFILLLYIFSSVYNAYAIRLENEEKYIKAQEYLSCEDYLSAREQFSSLGIYKDSKKYAKYANALFLMKNERFDAAMQEFEGLKDFENSEECYRKIKDIKDSIEKDQSSYLHALDLYQREHFFESYNEFHNLGDFKDSKDMVELCKSLFDRHHLSKTISAGIQFSAGVTNEGHVLFAGKNFSESAKILSWDNIVSVAACNEFFMGLKGDGTVVTATRKPHYGYRIDTSNWSNIIDIAAGEQYVVGLREDGTLTAQGINGYGELDIDHWENIVQIDTSWQCTAGLDRFGQIYITGFNSEHLLAEISSHKDDWDDIVSISIGGSTSKDKTGRGHIVALKKDGTVVAAGDNTHGQCNVHDWTDIIAISAGDYHTVGVKSDGTVLTTQSGNRFKKSIDEISAWQNIVAVSAGYGFTLGLHSDGTVSAVGLEKEGQCDVDSWLNIAIRDEWMQYIEH